MRRFQTAFAGIGLSSILLLSACGGEEKQKQIPNLKLPTYTVETQDVAIKQTFVASLTGVSDIPIRARVDGYLLAMTFEEGRMVKKGQQLYEIDPAEYLEKLTAAQSNLSQMKVNAAKAHSDLERIKPLAEINAMSQSDLDAAQAASDAADEAVKSAEAEVKMAEIFLGYTKLKSPIDGLIGKSEANIGEYVGKSPNPVILNTVSNIDSMQVEFFLTESDYLLMMKRYVKMKRQGYDAFSLDADEEDRIELILSDGSVFEHKGYVKFLNREIDPTTGTILLQAIFPNPDKVLRPGQFAKVRGRMANVEDAVVIPQRCVMDQQGNKFVYVVDSENKVNIRFITISYTIPGSYLVSEGLKKGDVILVEGLIKVRPGATIDPIDYKEAMKMQKAKQAQQGKAQPEAKEAAKNEEKAESKQ